VFLGGVVSVWFPLALPFYWLAAQDRLPGGDLLPTALLYLLFLVMLPRWERHVHQIRRPWYFIGLTSFQSVWRPFVKGIGLGLLGIIALAITQLGLGWAKFVPLEEAWLALILAGGVTAIAVGWAEELLFRGWLLRELELGGSATMALISTSLIFALAHFIKPLNVIWATLPQLVGLLVLGLLLGLARHTPVGSKNSVPVTSLGYPVGVHGGLVWGYYILNVGQVLQTTEAVPQWVTGLDGNPLAGVLGIGLLGLLTLLFYGLSGSHPAKV
jgi:hypothetical protein